MTQEEKQLLLKDLCARLPYGVKTSSGPGILELTPRTDVTYIVNDGHIPYLRPLSSMTKEEREYVEELSDFRATPSIVRQKVDFYLERHLDYRGLIPMGLALEAPEGMYKTE